jgi:GT2 family glycosyltransferase
VRPTLSVIVVTWNNQDDLPRTLSALLPQLDDDDELIVVDNGSADGTLGVVSRLAPESRLVPNPGNVGFAAAANAGAALARGQLLVLLNPDAAPMAGWSEAIRLPWTEGRGWAAWQSLVADRGGARINSAGNPVHFTGLVWAGRHGCPIDAAPAPAEVPALSGACLVTPRQVWREIGGFADDFFLYHEDVDLSLRLRLRGGVLGIEPTAVVDHEYEFGSRQHKWRMLERNRWAFLLRVYPLSLLLLLLPALLVTELVLLPVCMAAGWGAQKAGAFADVLRWLPRLLAERRLVQSGRRLSAAEFAAALTPDLDSPFIPGWARSRPIVAALRAYWWSVQRLLGLGAALAPGRAERRQARPGITAEVDPEIRVRRERAPSADAVRITS